MIRGLFRWSGGIIAIALLLVAGGTAWLLATESGARWLLHRASPFLPGPLQIGEVHGTLLRGLEFRDAKWTDQAAEVSVRSLDTRVELLPLLRRQVLVSHLAVRNVDVSVRKAPPADDGAEPFSIDIPLMLRLRDASIDSARIVSDGNEFLIDSVRVIGELSGSELKIQRFDLRSALADVALSGEATLKGDYAIDAAAAWELRLADQPPVSGILGLRGDARRYELKHDLDAPYEIATRGTVAFADDGITLDLENSWAAARIARGDAPALELVDGKLRVSGNVTSLSFDGATTVSSANIPAVSVQTNGRFDGERIDFESLSAANDWGQLRAKGQLLITPELSWSFDVALSEVDPSVADARLNGSLALAAKTSGRLVQGLPSLKLVIERLSGDLNGYPVGGSGAIAYVKERLKFDNAIVRVGDNRIDFHGFYGRELGIDADANFPDLSQLGLGVAGVVNGRFRLASDLNTFEASGSIRGESLAWNGLAIDTITADFDLPVDGDGTIVLQAASAEQGNVSTEIQGRFLDDEWSGAVRTMQLSRDWMGEWALRDAATFSLSRSRLNIDKFCLGTTSLDGNVCGAIRYERSGPLQFEASIDDLPLAALPRYLPEGATLLGEIAAEARGEFANGQLNSSLLVEVRGLGLIATFEGDEASAMFEKAALRATVVNNRLDGEFEFKLENSVDHVSGTLGLDNLFDQRSPLRGQGDLELNDLALVSFFLPEVANPKGRVSGRIEAEGSLAAPELRGEIGLRDGAVDIRRAGISVSEIGLLLRQSQAGELSLQGSAKSGEGYLQIDGKTSFSAESGLRSEIRLEGEDFGLSRLPDLQVTASPTIAVLLDDRETRISGELGIPQASITVQSVPEATEKPSADVVVHRGEAAATIQPRRFLYVDVTTKLGEAVSFNGFGLTTRLEGSVRINGDSRTPYQGRGRVVLREGRYQAYGQNLEIESGELIFNGPLTNPALNVRATRTASDKTVAGIQLTGTPAQLKSEVYSEPPLGDAEALSYLLTGRPLSNASSAEGDMLNQAAFALGLTTAGSVASRIRNELGLETLGFQGSAENRQLVAGKRFGDRLFVEYAYGVVDSLGTLLLRYQLSQRLVVESRSGTVRNVDVVYSVKKP